jgi:hypothetical protein
LYSISPNASEIAKKREKGAQLARFVRLVLRDAGLGMSRVLPLILREARTMLELKEERAPYTDYEEDLGGTLTEQRSAIASLLEESPSLAPTVLSVAGKEYAAAVRRAADETGLARGVLPAANPYTREQLLDLDFVP